MAPDRGPAGPAPTEPNIADEAMPSFDYEDDPLTRRESRTAAQRELAERASAPQNFTLRGILLGLVVGVVICFSNVYFGLQTGWISGMSMPSALIGFGFFRAFSSRLKMPFTPVENVLVQSVASSVGTMPLGCGFVGVMPALEYLLRPSENGPLNLSLGTLTLWAVGICLFGCVFAVPLRTQVILREKLKFPTGSATALMIGVLHGSKEGTLVNQEDQQSERRSMQMDEQQPLKGRSPQRRHESDDLQSASRAEQLESVGASPAAEGAGDWKGKIHALALAFGASALYTVGSYFIPQVRNIPIFGMPLAENWLWTLNPSPAYAGQGIIMGPATTLHMLLGAVIGWGILSPLAKHKGWAPGDVSDWEDGSKGWIVWISLAIMLADSLVSLGWLILRPLIYYSRVFGPEIYAHIRKGEWKELAGQLNPSPKVKGYTALVTNTNASNPSISNPKHNNNDLNNDMDGTDTSTSLDTPEEDAPPEHLISGRTFLICLTVSLALYFASIHLAFPHIIPFTASLLALVLALFLSLMGVRALGETDLNPVSGISKLTQLVFAFIIPATNPNAIIINLVAGAVSEAGALQAGDLLQDLKTGHLLGAAPDAQFYGQLIGSVVGAVVSAAVYRLYTNVYAVPGDQFQVPTAFVWIFTARLVTGSGLPPHAAQFAAGAAAVFAVLTALRTRGVGKSWQQYIPGGIAVAVGMYNTPSFTLARAIGGGISWYWTRWRGKSETGVVVLASGLILGEGLCSIVNLVLASFKVPHL